jgi:hypothetical protein
MKKELVIKILKNKKECTTLLIFIKKCPIINGKNQRYPPP